MVFVFPGKMMVLFDSTFVTSLFYHSEFVLAHDHLNSSSSVVVLATQRIGAVQKNIFWRAHYYIGVAFFQRKTECSLSYHKDLEKTFFYNFYVKI